MVVISIIMILISILLPSLRETTKTSKRLKCMNNQHDLLGAWAAYSIDNKRLLVKAHPAGGDRWVRGGNSEAIITGGALYDYVNNIDLYRCPEDWTNHVRTYSMNNFLAGGGWPHQPWRSPIRYSTTIQRPGQQMVFVEENDPRGWNLGSWVIYPDTHPSRSDRWIDYVGVFHDDGDNVGFSDGHVEYWEYEDSRTRKFGDGGWHFFSRHPDNADLKRYQSVYNPGSPPY